MLHGDISRFKAKLMDINEKIQHGNALNVKLDCACLTASKCIAH